MRKIFVLLTTMFLLSGCADTVALLGTSISGVSSGKVIQSSLTSSISYGVKRQTGKGPLEHAKAYAEKMNPEKKKEPCLSFIEKTNSEICLIVKKQIDLTKSKIFDKNKKEKDSLKDLTSSLKSNIDHKSKIKYLD